MEREVVVIGGGMAGLTAASYLCKAGMSVTLLEKEGRLGGLVNSFERGGFVFDGGIRAIENSGIVRPMLEDLGVDVDFLESRVSVGFGSDVVRLSSRASLEDYRELLELHFPDDRGEVGEIIAEVARVMGYMDVLYGIDNPLFMNLKDPRYVFRTILPWILKYIMTMPKVAKLNMPIDDYLARFTDNRSLIDMVAQHFFRKTPSFFALSYFSLYLDYRYPRGGTGSLPGRLEKYIREKGGKIGTGVEIVRVEPGERRVVDARGVEYAYDRLLWAADTRMLYRLLHLRSFRDGLASKRIAARAREVSGKRGGDSVFTLYLSLSLEPSYFSGIASGHFFYTPVTTGLSAIGAPPAAADKAALLAWIGRFFDLNTFEISVPVLRDPSLAPPGKTGLIVSVLMDHALVAGIRDTGWYEEFKAFSAGRIARVLDAAIFPGLEAAIIDSFTSTPLSIEKRTGNSDGAITGWAFTNDSMPAVHRLTSVARSVLTPIPGVYQAGQWSYSPAGLPISILTGKLAADAMLKSLRR